MVPSAANRLPENSNKIAAASNNRYSKQPRFDPYGRLLHRFFEALILLHVLGQTRGSHDTYRIDAFTPQEKLEAKTIIRLDGDRRLALEDKFTQRCIRFAKYRVKKEAKKLWKAMDEADEKYLDLQRNSNDIKLWRWLQQFREQDLVDLCYLAYEQRRAEEMGHVVAKIDTAQCGQGVRTASDVFYEIRHYVGRLAHHVRAPKQVLEDFACLAHVLDTYDIRLIGQVSNIEPPAPDGLTTLEGILKRMLPANDRSLPEYEDSLALMNQKFGLEEKILNEYGKETFKPNVHAEVQVLEHFHENGLSWAGNDRYIGYKIYLNWGPPLLPEGAMDPRYKQQRKLMNDMLVTIRREALDQLKNKAGPLKWHPDSHTGITRSLASEPVKFGALRSVEDRLAALDLESPDPSNSESEGNRPAFPIYTSTASVKAAGSSSQQSSDSSDDDDSDSGGGVSLS
ncbi:hypothetical protein DL770_004113 [Monosporascus sp. CRB-9-2]|nr:hypothetical protein DL770_004113 [Monosporascus sp. CRB-9-2]